MLKKKAIVVVALVCGLGMGIWILNRPSNSLDKNATPEEVVRVFLKAVAKGDVKTIQAVHDPNIWETIYPLFEDYGEGKSHVGYLRMVVIDSETKISKDGRYATVEIQDDERNSDFMFLQKMTGGWKITYKNSVAISGAENYDRKGR